MIESKYKKAFSEVYVLLMRMEQKDRECIPQKLLELIEKNMDKNYIPTFENKQIKDLSLMTETKGILGFFFSKYWAKNEEDKQEFINLLRENEIKFRKQSEEK